VEVIKYHTVVTVTWKYYASNTQERKNKPITTKKFFGSLQLPASHPVLYMALRMGF